MYALVTGGAGFLGRCLVEQLLARGDRVRVFCRGEYDFLRALPVEVVRGDVRDLDPVDRAVRGVETVFHTAALAGIWGPRSLYFGINAQGTRNVIAACRRHRVGRLLITSSPSVIFDDSPHVDRDESLPYPNRHLCHYAASKAEAEREVLAANGSDGLATCSLRPHLIWGPGDNHLVPRVLRRALAGKLRRVGDGTNRISQIYIDDAAAAHLQAADRLALDSPLAGQAYFLDSGEPVKLWNWIDDILARAGLPPVTRHVSHRTAYRFGGLLEIVSRSLGLRSEPMMTRFVANQLALERTYRSDKARRDFGFEPTVDWEAGMRRLADDLPRMLAEIRRSSGSG